MKNLIIQSNNIFSPPFLKRKFKECKKYILIHHYKGDSKLPKCEMLFFCWEYMKFNFFLQSK